MSSLPAERARPLRDHVADPSLYDLLIALGFAERERVSVNTQLPGKRFMSELHEVRDLAGWSPLQDRNVWFGVNPVARQVHYGRGTEADITRARSLFADLDVKPGKCLDTLDQCYAAARTLADYLDTDPVALIESGHGLQPLWRVGSPRGDSNVIDRDWTRQEFRETWWRFGAVAQNAAQNAAQKAVWSPDGAHNHRTIDGVFNLDRILRCPGSINWKDPDDPVPVQTHLITGSQRVLLRDLVARLDAERVQPLKRVRETMAELPTNFDEATEWIEAQVDATLELAELRALRHVRPMNTVLWEYLDAGALVRVLADGDEGAHAEMRNKVLHAVFSAQEGRAGLVVALRSIGEAYLAVMEARAAGELPGDVRDGATAAQEWANAVRGAVAKARARGRSVVTRVDVSVWEARVASS
ncbi:hypothetical protein [Mycolicibacterium sp.]|uniref:hypothetical protein n=1 Tax=Mycolicibacterium sp. TaxID=2320850 RepID=UPI003D0E0A1A